MPDSYGGGRPVRYLNKAFDVRVTPDLRFGVAGVDWTRDAGAAHYRPLLLDIYEPSEKPRGLRPALVMLFGGGFQRGTRQFDVVGELPHRNSAISEYCAEFARRGYVCFSADYRLMPEMPDPGTTPTWIQGASFNIDRANFVRNLMGLAPCTLDMMIDEIEAATDDASMALTYVRSRCHSLMVDPSRIAIGGFSAGATIAMNAAFAENAPVAAVVALSGRMTIQAARRYIPSRRQPPLFMAFGENDLPSTLEDLELRNRHFENIGFEHQVVHLPGATHFYPRSAQAVLADGTAEALEDVAASFLYKYLRLAELLS